MKIRLLLLFILLFPCFAAATDWNNLPGDIVNALLNAISLAIIAFLDAVLLIAGGLIAMNPNPFASQGIVTLHSQMLLLLMPLYLVIFTFNGLQIMTSRAVSTQTSARSTIQNTIIGAIFVVLSKQIYELLLNVAQAIAGSFVIQSLVFPGDGIVPAHLVLLIVAAIVAVAAALVLIFRIAFIFLGAVLFPVAIFMYFFGPTKSIGSTLIKIFLFAMCLQILFAIILAVMSIASDQITAAPIADMAAEVTLRLMLFLASLVALIVVPLLALGGALIVLNAPIISVIMPVITKAAGVASSAGKMDSSKSSAPAVHE